MVVVKIGLPTLLIGGAVISAVVFKPDRASFERFFRTWVKEQLQKDRDRSPKSSGAGSGFFKFISGLTDSAVSEVFTRLSEQRIDDYFLCSVATVVLDDVRYTFVGAYNGWLLVDSRRV